MISAILSSQDLISDKIKLSASLISGKDLSASANISLWSFKNAIVALYSSIFELLSAIIAASPSKDSIKNVEASSPVCSLTYSKASFAFLASKNFSILFELLISIL